MIRILLVLMLWAVQAVLVLLLIDSQWVEGQMKAEQADTAAHLGEVRYGRLHENAEEIYRRWFVQSGAVETSYTRILPDAHSPKEGMDNLAPWFFTWLEHRLDALWWLLYQAVHRLQLIGVWSVYLGALLAVAIVDGGVRWRIKRATHTPPSSDRYIVGCRALLLLSVAPLMYLSIPMNVHPGLVPIWGCLLALSIILFGANLQHRV